eukprot:TRINITY_DN289_c1_g1_i10.p2 TRINITY_DN289_c1_g1~~TRINITY_DN289_c1_g1_i10.p2  ORF type:complete len:102 (+),score=1.23 TRINITY_DN289_c1_g1_i10:2-307(+)
MLFLVALPFTAQCWKFVSSVLGLAYRVVQDDEPSDDDSACPNATDQEIWPDPIDLVSITHGLFAFGKVTVNTGAGPAVATPAGGGCRAGGQLVLHDGVHRK